MTGAAAEVVRELGLEGEVLRRNYPKKKGVKVIGTNGKTRWWVPVASRNEKWELEDSFSWQVLRSDFDQMLLEAAVGRGARHLTAKALRPIRGRDGSVSGLEVRKPHGEVVSVESEMLLDCSGEATFLANHRVTGPKYLGNYDKQVAFFSQVSGAVRDPGGGRETDPDNTVIFYEKKFHWAWFLPLDDKTTSVGVVVPSDYFKEKNETREAFLTRELKELNPALRQYLPEVNLVSDVHTIPNYSYQVRRFTGKGFICIGDAHRFIDPIFSFGITVAMREGQMVAPVVKEYLDGKRRDTDEPFADYERACEAGIDVLEDMIDSFWEFPLGFAKYVHFDFKNDMIDVFAGRIYENLNMSLIGAFRRSLKRDRSQDNDLYSVPIGSRFHPERAAIWEPDSPTQGMEEWIEER